MKNINEGLSDILYHFTYFGALLNILRQNEFHASTNIGTSADLNTSAGRFFFFSATRSRGAGGSGAGFGRRSVKLVLDGRKLGQRYKGFPIDYWNYSSKESDWGNKTDYINSLKSKELEDRIVLDSPTIPNAASYILEIHMMVGKGSEIRKDVLDSLMGYVKQYSIPIYFYTDKTAYFNQVKDKAVDPYSVYSFIDEEPYVSASSRDKLWGVDRVLYLLMHNDDGNRSKILDFFKFDEDEMGVFESGYKKDLYNYLMPNAVYDYEYYSVISSEVHNMRSNTEPKYKFVMKMLADDLRKYKAKNLKEYIKMKTSKKVNESITDVLVNKAHMLYEEIEDIPYAEQLPDEETMYEFGKKLYDKTQTILNTVGAKIMNTLTMNEVGANIVQYKGILGRLIAFKTELSDGMDRIYDHVEQAGYGSSDPEVKKLDAMYDELDNDLIILGDIKDILDTMIFTAEGLSRNHTKAFKLGMKNINTDIALRESNGKGFDYGEKQAVSVYDVSQKELAGIFNSRKRAQLYLNGTKDSVYNSIKNKTVIKDNRFGVPITFRLATTQQRELLGDKDMLILSSTFKYADLARHNKRV